MAGGGGRSMEETAMWAVGLVCFILVIISIFIEQIIHHIGSWLRKKHKTSLYDALEKIKSELMLMGFISLLLTVLQKPISKACISLSVAASWHPSCPDKKPKDFEDDCSKKGKAPLMSTDAIHELHIFIFVLAVFHVLYCITTLALGRLKMRRWIVWENETKSVEYQFTNDPERFRFTRDTSFGRRHLKFWSRSTLLVWCVCFYRQFFKSVTKVDYLTLRHGFITAHLAPASERKFDFRNYIIRSLDEDFKVVVGISPIMWFFAVLFLLGYTNGWYSYYWLPFIPLIIILLVGTKLQMIITNMGVRISERADVVKGDPVVRPDDDLFWFSRPRLMLFLIHFVLFQNAFQLAFFVFSSFKYGLVSCFHRRVEDVVIRISMGVVIHVLCSYITLPLYALVTQMGSTMKPTVFSERVAEAIKSWHHSTKKHAGKKRHHDHQSRSLDHDGATTPCSISKQSTPPRGSSPVHLLHNYQASPSTSPLSDSDYWQNAAAGSSLQRHNESQDGKVELDLEMAATEMEPRATTGIPQGFLVAERDGRSYQDDQPQRRVAISLSDFSFQRTPR